MALSVKPYKGARDFYPEDKRIQKYMFGKLRQTVESFGYQEYDAPIIEPTDLYLSKSSDEIVAEQTYSFTDRGERSVTLRPEMTPTVSRMVAGRRQELSYPLRWYSIPNLWRYERPQAGRLREHWQLNVDLFGVTGIAADHEIISVADAVLKSFGASADMYEIRINSRQLINSILIDYIGETADQVQDAIRLIDHKAKMPHEDFMGALAKLLPDGKEEELHKLLSAKSFDQLPHEYAVHPSVGALLQLKSLLKESGVTNVVDDLSLMRGFDYYTDIVFEVFDTHKDNNRSMFGGGRYDGLVAMFGVQPVPTVGFGMGDVTLRRFLELHSLLPELKPETDAVAILAGDVYRSALAPIETLRKRGLNIAIDSSGRKLDAQLRAAVKSNVPYALFIGEEELKSQRYKLRNLAKGQEHELTLAQVAETIKAGRVRHSL
jgi:histidyl-tRNA synthetase